MEIDRKRRNGYALRTCKACKASKKQCQLPPISLLAPPSEEGVDPCVRCKRLGHACILDDYARESKIRRLSKRLDMPDMSTSASPSSSSDQPLKSLGSRLLMLEMQRQVAIASQESTNAIESPFKKVSMTDLDTILDDDLVQSLSWWSHNELRLWFSSLKSPSQYRMLRHHSFRPVSPAATILEAGQYCIAARHLSIAKDSRQIIIDTTEALMKTSLSELLMSSKILDDDSLLAIQLVSYFQVSGSLSLPLLAASTKAARLALLASPRAVNRKLAWCSACVWEACIALGLPSGIELFRPDEYPDLAFVEDLSALVDMGDAGVRCLLLRARNIANASKAWKAMMSGGCNIGDVLADWNEACDNTLPMVDDLDSSQQPFVRLELDIANTLIYGRALDYILEDSLASEIAAAVSVTPQLKAFLGQRHHLDDLMSAEERQAAANSEGSYDDAAQTLISTLFGTALTSSSSKVAHFSAKEADKIGVKLPRPHALGYVYEASTAVLRMHAPLLGWLSSAPEGGPADATITWIKRLLESIASTPPNEDAASSLGAACSKLEHDFIINAPFPGLT